MGRLALLLLTAQLHRVTTLKLEVAPAPRNATNHTNTSIQSIQVLTGVPASKPLDGRRNICLDGHFVPELLVIGSFKAGTNRLCMELRRSASMVWPRYIVGKNYTGETPTSEHSNFNLGNWKEGHYFDSPARFGRAHMVVDFPRCDTNMRHVAIDCTSRNSGDPSVPRLISEWYGPVSRRLSFVVMVREPLERLHSHYYASRRNRWCQEFSQMTFRTVVQNILQGYFQGYVGGSESSKGMGCGDVLEGSLYYDHLVRYFRHFEPTQFTLVPYKFQTQATAPGRPRPPGGGVAKALLDRIGAQGVVVQSPGYAKWEHHSALTEDLSKDEVSRMSGFLDQRTGAKRLADFIAFQPMFLYGYTGDRHDRAAIKSYIEQNW